MITINWAAYSRLFPSDSQDGFDRFWEDATLRMDVLTANRWRKVTDDDWRADRVRRCLAELLHLSIAEEQSPATAGITSISNDGYSESYARATPEEAEAKERAVSLKWLSCTGLVSAL